MIQPSDIEKMVKELVSSYDYEKDFLNILEEKKKEILASSKEKLIKFSPGIAQTYDAENDAELAAKIANDIIAIRKNEKIYSKLVSEGFLYPAGIRNNNELFCNCTYKKSDAKSTVSLSDSCVFPVMIYNAFLRA